MGLGFITTALLSDGYMSLKGNLRFILHANQYGAGLRPASRNAAKNQQPFKNHSNLPMESQ
jgi:hypothetical protein